MQKPLVLSLQLSALVRAGLLLDGLQGLTFVNNGVTNATDKYIIKPVLPLGGGGNILMEPDNVTTMGKWSYPMGQPWIYKYKSRGEPTPCQPGPEHVGFDMPGGDSFQIIPSPANSSTCKDVCCGDESCAGYVFAMKSPADFGSCKLNEPCCFFKGSISPFQSNSIVTSAVVKPAAQQGVHPPSGIRSAIPLGGIASGAVELRGDGTLHEWTLTNQDPGGASKIQQYPGALFAARTGQAASAKILQTAPLVGPKAAGVASIAYSGSYPVSRLQFVDPALPSAGLTMHAFSTFTPGDQAASSRPAVAFVLSRTDATDAAVPPSSSDDGSLDFMFQLPLNVETDQVRAGTPLPFDAQPPPLDSAEACLQACQANPICLSWVFARQGNECTLQSDSPNNVYLLGTDSGLRFEWTVDTANACLILQRPGDGPAAGGVSLCASLDGEPLPADQWSAGTSDNPAELFSRFTQSGAVTGSGMQGAYGAISVSSSSSAQPQQQQALVVTMGWHFPRKDHYGQVVGNQYSRFYRDSTDAAWGRVPTGTRSQALAQVVADIKGMHAPFYESSLPVWLSDQLVNSLSHIRTAMWFADCAHCHVSNDTRLTNLGFWRQWESYACDDLDSIHNDGERHIPYLMFFPNTTRSKLAAWAGNQQKDGMLAEQIHNANPDQAEGRVMADSSSMFVLYLLELLNWDQDITSLKLYWPTCVRILQWAVSTTAKLGVPYKLQTTYDQLNFPAYDASSYSTAFHMVLMRACLELASHMEDSVTHALCQASLANTTQAFDTLQWAGDHYAGCSDGCTKAQGCSKQVGVFADTFYPQVLAYTLGMGSVFEESKLASHLKVTASSNCAYPDGNGNLTQGKCPNGLLTFTGRPPSNTDWELWQMINHDFATLSLNLGNGVEDSLEYSKRSAAAWATLVNDQWGTAALSDVQGLPTCINHYGYHMTSWHIPMALSGQITRLYPPQNSSLTFAPKLPNSETTSWSLPVLAAGVLGSISYDAGTHVYALDLNFGVLSVKILSVDGCDAKPSDAASGLIQVKPGQPVSWSC